MHKLSLLDLGFIIAESAASPKHVGGLMIFKRPPRAKAGFARELYRELLTCRTMQPPFNRVLQFSLTAMPVWRDSETVDLHEHLFYHRLPRGKNDRADLYAFVAGLHQPMLDRSRPLWQVHVIDGLSESRFALYVKMHHACADGVTMVRWTVAALATTPDDQQLRPLWSYQRQNDVERQQEQQARVARSLLDKCFGAGKHLLSLARLTAMMLLESAKLTRNAVSLPFVAEGQTPLTGQVTAGRQFTTACVTMERVRTICRHTRSTLNHVALTCLDGALHRYLRAEGVELQRPITIQMPVNLRKTGDTRGGNKIGIIQVQLSELTDDPYVRLRNIGFSLRNVRSMIDSVEPEAIESYTLITALIGQLVEMFRLSNYLPPVGNTLISNVPGPADYIYLRGARLEELHPISTLPPGNLLNITLFSYAGRLYFGLIASDELPNLDRLSAYVGEAFEDLERSVGC
ncbi:MAG TPA: wax ester/triacylglycerol synthase family O-acyltransferase [Accumulibacter sp.]|nr:wax ester/triacylglycerol synthase family O-acyltransferase [Accumulibacter sp.]